MPTHGSWRPLVTISVSSTERVTVGAAQDRGGRLDSEPGDDRLSGRNAAENAAGMVGEKARLAIVAPAHLVGVLLAGKFGRGEAVADLDPFDGVDPHQRGGEFRIELAVDRRAPARGHALGDNLDHRADRGAGLADVVEIVGEARGGGGVGGEERISARPRPSPSVSGRSSSFPICTSAPRTRTAGITLRAIAPAATRAAVSRAEDAATAAIIADAVLCVIGVVGMAGTVLSLISP